MAAAVALWGRAALYRVGGLFSSSSATSVILDAALLTIGVLLIVGGVWCIRSFGSDPMPTGSDHADREPARAFKLWSIAAVVFAIFAVVVEPLILR